MTLRAYPFDNITTTEVDVSKLFREFQNSGIAASANAQDFSVYATGSDGMQVFVRAGFAIINGYALDSSAVEAKNIQAASTTARNDLVVLRCDPGANTITPEVLTGASDGSIPTPTWTDTDICELPLAVVNVRANVTAIDAADVTDKRKFLAGNVGIWKDGEQPTNPRIGNLGYNLTTTQWEYWDGSKWTPNVPANLIVSTVHADSMTVGVDNKAVLGTSAWGDPAAPFAVAPEGTSILGGVTLFGQKGTLTTVKSGSTGRQEFVVSDTVWSKTAGSCFAAWRSVDPGTGEWGQWQKLPWSSTKEVIAGTFTLTPGERNPDGTTYGRVDVSWPAGWFTDPPCIDVLVETLHVAAFEAAATIYYVTTTGCRVRVDFPNKMTSAVTVHIIAMAKSNNITTVPVTG